MNPVVADGRGTSHAWGVSVRNGAAGSIGPAPGGAMAQHLSAPDAGLGLAEFIAFESCLAGPAGGPDAGCDCFDADSDWDADLGRLPGPAGLPGAIRGTRILYASCGVPRRHG